MNLHRITYFLIGVLFVILLSTKQTTTIESKTCTPIDIYEINEKVLLDNFLTIYFKLKYSHQRKFFARWAHIAYNEYLYSRELGYILYPSVTLVQSAKESNWGRSKLTIINNNYFGIKGGKTSFNTEEVYNGVRVRIRANFRQYNTPWESWRDRSNFLLSKQRYNKVINSNSFKEQCINIKKCGYATEPNYHYHLINMVKKYKLFLLDKLHPEEAVFMINLLRITEKMPLLKYDYQKNRLVNVQ